MERLAAPLRLEDRSYRGFYLLSAGDLAFFLALARGEWQISGAYRIPSPASDVT